jgi:hypothetical protein
MPCFWCGRRSNCNNDGHENGLDRLEQDRGYEPDNVVSCCRWCNNLRYTMTVDDFRSMCDSICANFDANVNGFDPPGRVVPPLGTCMNPQMIRTSI